MADKRIFYNVAEQITGLINEGVFPPGIRFPSERELAKRFGVSRVTIRDAKIALQASGILETRGGTSVYVADKQLRGVSDLPIVTAFELTSARAIVEAEAAALAAANITDDGLEELQTLIQTMASLPPESHAEADEIDMKFHLGIARFSGNAALEYLVQSLWRIRTEDAEVRSVYAKVCVHDTSARTEEHAEILDTLHRRDPAAARGAMRAHFQRLFEAMLTATEAEALEEIRRKSGENRQNFLTLLQM